jgi:UDP-N-acetyl-D-mannosaminuronic acid dehydrogenase
MKPEVVTIGLGYIGLPTSALIASHNTNVLGVDINHSVVDTINKGEIHIVEPDLDQIVSKAVSNGFFKASTKPTTAEVYLIVVPTPFKGDHEPDISFIETATKGIIPLLKKGDLYIIESTSPIGTTENMQDLIYAARPELKGALYIAYCPERVLPGNVMHELVHNDRVIGGVDEASTQKAILFYSKYVKGELHKTNARTAEMCKLVENSSRDVQIAFANELSMICDKAEINVRELIELANKHPRVNILQPACGVGGHCIAVDPYFIVSNFPYESKIISKAREVNNFKPEWCVEKIKNAQLTFKLKNKVEPTIAILGLAFKPNIDDLRESPALHIAKEIYKESKKCMIVEPNICDHDFFILTDLKNAINLSDIIVVLVKHDEFKSLIFNENKILIDFCGI